VVAVSLGFIKKKNRTFPVADEAIDISNIVETCGNTAELVRCREPFVGSEKVFQSLLITSLVISGDPFGDGLHADREVLGRSSGGISTTAGQEKATG